MENDIHTAARLMAQDRIGQKKTKTVECRPFIGVGLPAKFEQIEINPAHDEAAHYRKTAQRDESGRPKKKTKTTGKMPLSQACLPGDEGKLEIKKKAKPHLTCQKLISFTRKRDL